MSDPIGMSLPVKPHRVSKRVLWIAAFFVLVLFGGILWGYRYQQAQNQMQATRLETAPKMEESRVTSFTDELGGGKSKTPATIPNLNPSATTPTSNVPNLSTPPLPAGFPPSTPAISTTTTPPMIPVGGYSSPGDNYRAVSWQREEHAMINAPADILTAQNPSANPGIAYQPYPGPIPTVNAQGANTDNSAIKAEPLLKRLPPEGEYMIPAGTWIPAQLGQKVVSDLAGDVEAITTENLSMVRNGQKVVLIPQKSRLIGSYGSRLAVGQNRLLQVWSKIVLPDNSYILLTDFNGTEADGSSGLTGHVNNHIGRLIRDAAITTAFAVGIALTQQRQSSLLTAPTFGDAASAAVGQQLAQIGGTQFANNFNRQPTVTLEPGKEFDAFINRSIVLDGPYSPMTDVFVRSK